MMVESFFVLLCKSLDFARHNVHFQVSVKVTVSNVPGCIDSVPKYFVLESGINSEEKTKAANVLRFYMVCHVTLCRGLAVGLPPSLQLAICT